jgi:deoxycytidylate deaminase
MLKEKEPASADEYRALDNALKTCRELYGDFESKVTGEKFIKCMQDLGDNLRTYGYPVRLHFHSSSPRHLMVIPQAVKRIMKSHRRFNQAPCRGSFAGDVVSRFVINAFRHPYEVEFFRRRYSEFYLICIRRNASCRKQYIENKFLNGSEVDRREKGEHVDKQKTPVPEWAAAQNVVECGQRADYFIYNGVDCDKNSNLRYHLIRLLCLAAKPGCVPPTGDERSMQIAMTARQMSGCISRQVGATVVGESGYVLGIGWNDVPEGQVPCALRTAGELLKNPDKSTFSDHERSKDFCKHIKEHINGEDLHKPFCFKDQDALLNGENKKRAEYTRSLHAEENAFLQVAKVGGSSVVGSKLYTTAMTCALCAKKAYQLGVEKIVYIEEYDELANNQALNVGTRRITIEPFEGATGSAFFRLFSAIAPEKDMIKLAKTKGEEDAPEGG